MSSTIQPGSGYGFTSGGFGFSLDTTNPFQDDTSGGCVPLRVNYKGYEAAGSVHSYQVCVGTINNRVPQILEDGIWVKLDRVVSGDPSPPTSVINFTAGLTYFYLRCGKSAATGDFPDPDSTTDYYPKIASSGTVLTDTDEYGYVLIAHASANASNIVTLYQDVSGSLWGDRIKVAGQTAKYYYARI
jgi:hypothetical protein